MVFADGDMGQNLVGWGAAAVAGLGGFGAALFAYLANRDKLRFDVESKQLRRDVDSCEKDRIESKQRIRELEGKATELAVKAETAVHDRSRMEGQISSLERSDREKAAEIKELRDRLYSK